MNDLDRIEQVAKAAAVKQVSFGGENPRWVNDEWSAEAISPVDVLALVARIREAKHHIEVCKEAAWVARGQCSYCNAENREQCGQCGAEILGYHQCQGVPGGFTEDE